MIHGYMACNRPDLLDYLQEHFAKASRYWIFYLNLLHNPPLPPSASYVAVRENLRARFLSDEEDRNALSCSLQKGFQLEQLFGKKEQKCHSQSLSCAPSLSRLAVFTILFTVPLLWGQEEWSLLNVYVLLGSAVTCTSPANARGSDHASWLPAGQGGHEETPLCTGRCIECSQW